jgi:hypothetical protein
MDVQGAVPGEGTAAAAFSIELAIKGDCVELRSARPRYRLEQLIDEITPTISPSRSTFLRPAKSCFERRSRRWRPGLGEAQSAGRT